MDAQGYVVAALVSVICLGAPVAAGLSILLLRLYRRAVRKGMRQRAGIDLTPPKGEVQPTGQVPASSLSLVSIGGGSIGKASAAAEGYTCRIRDARRRTAGVYLLAGLVYAAILSSSFLFIMTRVGGMLMLLPAEMPWWELYPPRFLVFLWWYSWPSVLTISLILTTSPLRRLALLGLYFLTFIPIAIFGIIVAVISSSDRAVAGITSGLSFLALFALWLLVNGFGSILLGAFLNRRVRAVGPLVLTFTLLALAGISASLFGFSYLMNQQSELIYNPTVIFLFGIVGAFLAIILIALVGLALFGLLGIVLMRWLGRFYQRKQISDQSIQLDAIWLFFSVYSVLIFLPLNYYMIFAGVGAFLTYKLISQYGLRRVQQSTPRQSEIPALLLLRVFSLGAHSQRLFDALSQRWLYLGSISLIAGPDLLTAIVEPHEFLAFLAGRISRQFVQDQADLEKRLASIDALPDPDGRYRVNEFFCRADTWQVTMQHLSARSDAILMDLRSFSPTNKGCLYEIEQLLSLIPLDRCLLLVDSSTDKIFLEQSIQELWQKTPQTSPNWVTEHPELRVLNVSSTPDDDANMLIQLFERGVTAHPTGR